MGVSANRRSSGVAGRDLEAWSPEIIPGRGSGYKCIARFVEARRCGVFRNRRRLVPCAARNRIRHRLLAKADPLGNRLGPSGQATARFPPIIAGGKSGHSYVYGHMHRYRPARALAGHCYSISDCRYGHPEQDRAISLREAAALQSFPDPYRFSGTATEIARSVGNAVPVRLAECLGKHLLRLQRAACLKAA